MASVPNLPIAPAVPVPGAPGAAGEGAALDIFAQLLTGGPAMAVVAGPGAEPAEEVSLRAAPVGDDAEGGEEGTAGDVPPDIIPLLQAQSGFPVAVTPPAQAAAPVQTAPVAALPVARPPDGQPVRVAAPVKPALQPTPDTQVVQPESDAAPVDTLVDAAVKAAVGKNTGKPEVRAAKTTRPDAVTPVGGKPVAAPIPAEQPRTEAAGPRFEAVVQPAAATAAAVQAASVVPAFPATPVAAQPAASAAPHVAELVVERQLDLAGDDQWLDRLARDIARTSAGDEPLRFRLNPQTLGHLQVELSQSDRGATVRLTVETEAARNILVDAQPRLAAEARAQGVRLAGTEVDLGSAGQQGDDARRNAEARPQDVVRVVRATSSSSTTPEPAAGRSDRYA